MDKTGICILKRYVSGRKAHDDALSEIVSSLSLIVVLIIATGIILSFSTGQYPKVTIPHAELTKYEGSKFVNFSHMGGDNLSPDSIRIRVYNETVLKEYNKDEFIITNPDGSSLNLNTSGSDFGFGYNLSIPFSGENLSYQIILDKSGGEYLYREFKGSGPGGSNIAPIPNTPTPKPTPNLTCNLIESDALFDITQSGSNPPTYQFSSSGNGTHTYTILGQGFYKTISEKNGSITIPNLANDRTYQVIHTVVQKDNDYPVCSKSSSNSLTIPGCPDSCYANFIYDSDPSNRLNISFRDRTEGAVEWLWNFGDGHTSTESNPSHVYSSSTIPSYKVTLTTGKNQCGNRTYCSSTKQVSINCSGNADFLWEYNSSTREPWDVTFKWKTPDTWIVDNVVVKPFALIWDFGDGNRKTISGDDWTGSILHGYNKCIAYNKDYSATLTVNTKDCGSYSGTKTVSLPCICYDNPIANFSIKKEHIGTPFVINVTNSSTHSKSSTEIIQWNWDMGDGNVIVFNNTSLPETFTYSYPYCGEYSIVLTVFDSQGCWDDAIRIASCGGGGGGGYNCTPGIPSASFDYSINERTVDFTDTSKPSGIIHRRQWDMGDGTRYNTPNITHTYANYGDYYVRLKVWDENDCYSDLIRIISLLCPEPKANFTITSHMTNPQEFSFTDTSIIPDGLRGLYLWDFGDGTSYPGQNPPDKTYTDCKTHPVRLRVTTNCGSWNETIKPAVCDCPVPEARFHVEQGSVPEEFRFINDSVSQRPITELLWEFGDGTISRDQAPTHRYATCGQYTARLKVTTDCGSSSSTILDITCGCPPPKPDFDNTCIGQTKVSFTDLSRATKGNVTDWQWNFGDGTTSSLPNPVHDYGEPGSYPVRLNISTDCGSSAEWTKQVTVPCCEMPVPGFRYTCNPDGQTVDFFDTTKTSGDSISDLLWEFGEGNSSTLQNPRHTYSGSGTWAVNLTATSSCGAKNTYQEKITTPCFCSPPLANFSTEILSSEPFTIRVRDTSFNPETITHWNWSFGDGTYSTGQNPPDHIYAAGCGEYLISLTVTNDCGTRDTFDKLICCPVYANFTYRMEPADGTAPLTVYFTDRTIGTPQSYGWTFGDGGFSSFKNPVHTYKTGGNYSATLHATSPCGGNETHSERINVNCPPVEALFNYTIVNEDPLIIQFTDLSTGDDIIDWNWYFGDGSMSKEQHPEHTYYFRDDYHVILTIKSACGSESTNSLYLPIGCLPLTITATAHEGGTISPSGNITVPCEWHQQFNITPHTCYDIYDVVIDKDQPNAQHLGPINNYTFVNVQFDQTIDAYFQLKHPQILASANQGGTIDPPGITYLDCGSNQTYTITADSCFNITDVIINGTEHLGPQSSPFTYTFTNVTRDQAIQAQFALKTFPINATAGEGGVISPTGIIYVLCGYNQVFTITSDNCYEISSVLINEIPLPGPFISPFQYTFPNVLQPQTIDAEFSFKNYNITASSGSNGRIVPSGIISVGCGSDRTLTIVPDPGYVVTDIIVNGESVGSYSSYTLSNIQSDQTIHVDFGLSGNWCPITGNVRTQGGTGVSGIRVDVWNQARTILERSGVSRADGSYTIMYPRQSSTHRIDLNCPSTTTWTTTNPSNGWVDNAQICNRNGRCVTLSQNFIGRIT